MIHIQLHLKSGSQDANGSVPCIIFHKRSRKSKIYWANGSLRLKNMTVSCLPHANIIMPSAMWLELSNLRVTHPMKQEMSPRTPDLLDVWRFGHKTTLKCAMLFLVYASKLCPHANSIWDTLAHLLTVKQEEHWRRTIAAVAALAAILFSPQYILIIILSYKLVIAQ